MKEEEKNVKTNVPNDNPSDDFSLKWGEGSIQNDVSSYTYQDPTEKNSSDVSSDKKQEESSENTITSTANSTTPTPPVVEEKMPVSSSNLNPPPKPEPEKVVENTEPANINKEEKNITAEPVTPLKEEIVTSNQEEPTTPNLDSAPPVKEDTAQQESSEEEKPQGKAKTVLLVLLFVFLLLFILFLPEITNFINLAMTRKEVQGNIQNTPTPSPTLPLPSATPSPSEDVTISLERIVTRFEESDMVKEIKEKDVQGVLRITSKENTITIDYQNSLDMVNRSSTYQLRENILSSSNADVTTATILVEAISQLQGNEEGLSKDIFEGNYTDYSLDTNGILIEENPNKTLTIQIDLRKTLTINPVSNEEE